MPLSKQVSKPNCFGSMQNIFTSYLYLLVLRCRRLGIPLPPSLTGFAGSVCCPRDFRTSLRTETLHRHSQMLVPRWQTHTSPRANGNKRYNAVLLAQSVMDSSQIFFCLSQLNEDRYEAATANSAEGIIFKHQLARKASRCSTAGFMAPWAAPACSRGRDSECGELHPSVSILSLGPKFLSPPT